MKFAVEQDKFYYEKTRFEEYEKDRRREMDMEIEEDKQRRA